MALQNTYRAVKGNRQITILAEHKSKYLAMGYTIYDGDKIIASPTVADPKVAELEKQVADLTATNAAQAKKLEKFDALKKENTELKKQLGQGKQPDQ
jgi:hypothetical protein